MKPVWTDKEIEACCKKQAKMYLEQTLKLLQAGEIEEAWRALKHAVVWVALMPPTKEEKDAKDTL